MTALVREARARRIVALPLLAILASVLAGCNGGTVDSHALTNDAAMLDSIACEGALLARLVTTGDSVQMFTRVQADELRLQASNLADALSQRDTVNGLEHRVRAKGREAARVARELELLHRHPSDPRVAARVARRLASLGGCS
jgi:hypothetical protein